MRKGFLLSAFIAVFLLFPKPGYTAFYDCITQYNQWKNSNGGWCKVEVDKFIEHFCPTPADSPSNACSDQAVELCKAELNNPNQDQNTAWHHNCSNDFGNGFPYYICADPTNFKALKTLYTNKTKDLTNNCPVCGQSVEVNTADLTQGICDTKTQCGLDAALTWANSCSSSVSTPTKITFKKEVFVDPAAVPAIKLTSTLSINPAVATNAVEIEGNKDKRILINGDNGGNPLATAFKVANGTNVKISNVHFEKFKAPGPLVQIEAGAKNTDLVNASGGASVALLKSNASDGSDTNVPVMVVPGSASNEYVVLAILPNDSETESTKLRFCETSDATTGDCTTAAIKVNQTKNHPLVDPSGKPTDPSKIIVEFTLTGVTSDKKLMALVKNTGKTVALPNLKTGLAPLFVDSDGDGLRDIDETTYFSPKADPNKSDTDADGITDIYNVIGLPGQPYAQISGADIYPAADANGFIPGDFKQQPAPVQNTDTSATEEKSGGCSMVQGGDLSPVSSSLMMIWGVLSLTLMGLKRRKMR